MGRLAGKVAIVLGAAGAGNMGQVIARRFRDEGANVMVAGRKGDELQRFADDIGAGWTLCDITSAADRNLLTQRRIDVLINNAAMGDSGSLAEVDIQRVRQLFEVNLFATLELTQVALRQMIERQSGTVLFISSIAGRVPMPFLMPYSMSKFALSAAAAGLRAEMDQLKKNVHIAVIEPGAIHTGFNQAMTDSKYAWMGSTSYFAHQAKKMQKQERATFKFLEARSTRGIVKQIVNSKTVTPCRRPASMFVCIYWYKFFFKWVSWNPF